MNILGNKVSFDQKKNFNSVNVSTGGLYSIRDYKLKHKGGKADFMISSWL